MDPRVKKLLIFVGVLVGAGVLTFLLYIFFFKPSTPGPDFIPGGPLPDGVRLPTAGERGTIPGEDYGAVPGSLPGSGQIPGATEPGPSYYRPEPVSKLVDIYAKDASVSQSGQVRYHNASDGKFYRVLPDGTVQKLSDQIFYNVSKVTWADTANKAVLEYPDASKIIYNFDSQKQVTLPRHWEEFSFSPDSNELAAKSLGLAPENRWLVVTKDDGTGTKLIEPLGENANRVNIDWSPSRQTVALSRTGNPQGADRQEVLFLGLNGENFKSTVVEGLDFMPQWSPSGKRLLYSVDSARTDFKPEIWVVDSYGDAIGSNRRSLKLNTWANKCAFAGEETLYCAVPRDLPIGAGMAPAVADSVLDDLYKIDLRTGLKTNIQTGGDYHINSIFYDQNNNKVIFTDPNQRGIFQVNL